MNGYIFNFQSHGCFTPNGKVQQAMTQADIDTHNKLLASAEWDAMEKTGVALLYLSQKDIPADPSGKAIELKAWIVSTWDGSHFCRVHHRRTSWHNMAGNDGRTDVWFTRNGATWHGVNIGDNQIVRCRRNKA